MNQQDAYEWIDLGEYICYDVDFEASLGPEPFHEYTVLRKNASPIHARGQFLRVEPSGTVTILIKHTDPIVFQCQADQINKILQDDQPVDINKSA